MAAVKFGQNDAMVRKAVKGLSQNKLNKLKEELEEWKNITVKIAIIGQSGSGKSTFINRFRGLTPKDKCKTNSIGENLYAPVGLKETTFEIIQYEFEENPKIQLYDLPGAGTKNFPVETYPKKIQMDQYDAFVLLTKDRFLESDTKILAEIIKRGKPYFFARYSTLDFF